MKKLFYSLFYSFGAILYLASCTSAQKAVSVNNASKGATDRTPQFIEGISISPSSHNTGLSAQKNPHPGSSKGKDLNSVAVYSNDIEYSDDLQFKYGILLNLPVEAVSNQRLLEFIEEWYGTPYRFGGTTRQGVDCSAFVSYLLSGVYGLNVPRSSKNQYAACKRVKKGNLQEGDLVFFNTRGGVSHVGVFLGNNKFIHASTSAGVMISDLADEYFARRFVASGRVE